MKYLVRNYKAGKEHRIDLRELGVVIFPAKQHLGFIYDKDVADALAKIPDVHVIRKVSGQSSTIPELEIIDERVSITRAMRNSRISEEQVDLTNFPDNQLELFSFLNKQTEVLLSDEERDAQIAELANVSPPEKEDDKDLLPYCGCGCGKRVKSKGNKFLRGHHLRKPKQKDETKDCTVEIPNLQIASNQIKPNM